MMLLSKQFFQLAIISSLLDSNTLLSNLFSNTFNLIYFENWYACGDKCLPQICRESGRLADFYIRAWRKNSPVRDCLPHELWSLHGCSIFACTKILLNSRTLLCDIRFATWLTKGTFKSQVNIFWNSLICWRKRKLALDFSFPRLLNQFEPLHHS
jgi:hypothetical protein